VIIDSDFMKKLSDLVEVYNKYLYDNNGKDQLDVHKELNDILAKLENFLKTVK